MSKGNAFCIPSATLLIIGGLNWGLVGLGMLIGRNLNLVNLLLGAWPTVEAIVYLLVGLAAVKVLVMLAMGKSCCGEKCEK
jgi:uncharacterized membrane protein YuzA (DUF378 family)